MSNGAAGGLRRELRAHDAGRGKRYRNGLKARVTAFAVRRRQVGGSWAKIAAELGLRTETVRRWCQGHGPWRRRMRAVEVVPASASRAVAVVSPSGFRVEGLSIEDAAALLRALG